MTIITLAQKSDTQEIFLVSDSMVGDHYRSISTISKVFENELVVVGTAGASYLVDRTKLLKLATADIDQAEQYLSQLNEICDISAIIAYKEGDIHIISFVNKKMFHAYASSPGTNTCIGDLGWLLSKHLDTLNLKPQLYPEYDEVVHIISEAQFLATGSRVISSIKIR